MRTILIPLDGSTFAERALPVARGIAVRTGARVHLVAVHQPALTSHGGRGGPTVDSRLDAELRAEMGRYLDRAKADLVAAAPTLSGATVLLEGPVAETLSRYAADIEADLIVLTTHGLGGPSGVWLGSVTDALVRAGRTPILAVRPSDGTAAAPEAGFARVVVALDGSPEGDEAIASAVAVAGSEGVEYTLLRVVQPLHPFLGAVATRQAYENDLRGQRDDAEGYLAARIERLRPQGLRVRPEVRVDGSPARAIVACAAALRADLIAMTTHGRGPMGRIVLGSVADKVLRASACPVLLRRAPADTAVAVARGRAAHLISLGEAPPYVRTSGGAHHDRVDRT